MSNITRHCAEFAANLKFTDLPSECAGAARTGMADCIGVIIAGAAEPAVQIVSGMLGVSTDNTAAPEIPSGRLLAAADAAFVNGVAAHVLDYDDVALAGHPSAVLTPAILAEGWIVDATGKDALTAYLAGYEIWAQLAALESGHLHDRGFHPTAVMGTLATAAACASLRRLNSEQTTHAIGIAASLASGLVANFGSMTKSLHAGRTAQSGVLAAQLAAKGFTASTDVLEHRTGFLQAHSPSGAPDITHGVIDLGSHWRMLEYGVNVKRYPTCYATHRAIDAAIALARIYDIQPEDVDAIRVRTGATQKLMLRNARPQTGLEAKFSMEFALAAAVVARRVGLSELTDTFVQRPDVVELTRKVQCTTTDEVMDGDQPFAPSDDVSIILKTGRVLEHEPVVHAKGSWADPLNETELREKFLDCAGRRMAPAQAQSLFRQLWQIENLGSLRELQLTLASG